MERRKPETPLEKEARLEARRQRDRRRRAEETPEKREARLMVRRQRDRERRKKEANDAREARLHAMRTRQRERRAMETEEEKEARLQALRAGEHERRAMETEEEREGRLQTLRAGEHERSAMETEEEREGGLQTLRAGEHERRAMETEEEREGRLQALRAGEHERRAMETEEEREARLHALRAGQQERRAMETADTIHQAPLLDQPQVQRKMLRFHSHMAQLQFNECSTCAEAFPSIKIKSGTSECLRCFRDKHKVKLYSCANNMHPDPVPPELQGLSQVEEMLISAVMPMMALYRLPYGQYGYSGHVLNLPQDVSSTATSLPHLPSELDIVIVRREGSSGSHRDFRVRRSVVCSALQWLMANNLYYRNIQLDHSALEQLPEDGDLPGLPAVTVEGTDDAVPHSVDVDDPYDAHLPGTFVPMNTNRMTEQETVQHTVAQRQQPGHRRDTPVVMWPATGSTPVNEFHTEGYMSCAFPTLFPTGVGDFTAPRERTVTIGYYLKHLVLYRDGRFAKHHQFRYFALNTEMRWRALQAGRIYIRQHPQDARLSVEELREMVGTGEGSSFSSRVQHFAASLRGTAPYWFKQRSRLIAMVDTLGLPTVFFTHSAADLQWPELAGLMCPDDPDSISSHTKALCNNPALADWFFYERISQFIKAFYCDVIGCCDYWMRFEWQHRGSPHVHGLAWLPNAPDVQASLDSDEGRLKLVSFVDSVVSTTNPAILPDGSNASEAPLAKTDPHICNKPYSEVEDIQQDLIDLIATCQRHTRCSAAYCLKTKNGQQQCRFGYPKPLQEDTVLRTDERGQVEVVTKRNDAVINSFNPVQLQAWRANVDMQYCISRHKVIEYCAKYATKCEPRSQSRSTTVL